MSPTILIRTTLGDVSLELFPEQAPGTVKNFLDYVQAGFYDDTVIHRVVPGFVVQGGGYDADTYEAKEPSRPIRNEATNGLKNERGTVAMARTANPHSATSQFFINLNDNTSLDHTDKTLRGWGYCVFGRVTDGMDVVDAIAAVDLDQEWPVQDVIIESIALVSQDEKTP